MPYWTTENLKNAIWWYNNRWFFGYNSNLGTTKSGTRSKTTLVSLYPHEIGYNWEYRSNNGTWLDVGENNEIETGEMSIIVYQYQN